MSPFKPAKKSQSKLRLALIGISGSGKTYTALTLAKHLGQRIAVIDTERGSASKYSGDVAAFDVLELDDYAPANYVRAIKAAGAAEYDVLVIDSMTHAWTGKGGAIEMVDRAQKRSGNSNSFVAWREVTPEHNAMVDAILQSPCHVIATVRAKTAYEMEENDRGRKVPKKIGMKPEQRDGLEYEFDVVADLDAEHHLLVTKTRCAALDRAVIKNPGEDVAKILSGWLTDGVPAPKPRTVEDVLADIHACDDPEKLDPLIKEGRGMWRTLPPALQTEVVAVMKAAPERVAERAALKLEAEQAERALSAEAQQQQAGEA